MQITSPFAYPEIDTLKKTDRVVMPKPGDTPSFCRELHVMPVSYTEIPVAQRDYPIVFVTSDNGASYMTMVILGLKAKQNLFVSPLGWDRSVYVPAYVRRFPFCMAKVTVDNTQRDERVVCVVKESVVPEGDALFDTSGNPTAEWQALEKLLQEYETDLVRSEELCKAVAEMGLLESFNMQASLTSGATLQLTGMHRVNETKLNELDPARLQELARKGVLSRVYSHLLSLENFRRLTDRAASVEPAVSAPPGSLQ
ncbi:MAG: SapC family protein [Proteobacteria bacterium]|nr:SapC family protein [Burkholderiales bacterium]